MCRQMQRSSTTPRILAIKKREALEDYLCYVENEGRLLNSGDITRLNVALYQRILRIYGSWANFREEVDVALRRGNERRVDATDSEG